MLLKRTEEPQTEARYDAGTLREVTALARQLQESRQETLTAEEIEAIGEEAGLGRSFVRDALKHLAVQQSGDTVRREREQEFRGAAGAWGLAALWSVLAWLAVAAVPSAAPLFTLVVPPLLAVAIGFLAGSGRAAMSVAVAFAMALVVAAAAAPAGWVGALAYLAAGTPLAAWLAWLGAQLREHYFPPRGAAAVSSPALLDLLVAVQRQLDEQAGYRAFLSIEVADAEEMRRESPEPLAAQSFGRFRQWVEEIVRLCGGECRAAAVEGLACVFPADAGAVSAARQIQQGMTRFNAEENRLSRPFRVRCGLTAGRAAGEQVDAIEAGLLERAAEVRTRADPGDVVVTAELAAAALLELGSLAPLPREAGADPLFSWQAGRRAHQRP